MARSQKPGKSDSDSDGDYKSVVIYQRSTTDALDKYVRIDAVYVSVGACDDCGTGLRGTEADTGMSGKGKGYSKAGAGEKFKDRY